MNQNTHTQQAIDILLICALKDEYDQVLEVTDGLIQPGWQIHPDANGWLVADAISNQNREIATSVYLEGDVKSGNIAGRDLHIHHYPPSEPTQPKTQTPKLFNVPIPRNPFFTGRSDILTKLHEALHESHEIAVTPSKKATALSGLGGVGKTQTVAEYAHRYQDD